MMTLSVVMTLNSIGGNMVAVACFAISKYGRRLLMLCVFDKLIVNLSICELSISYLREHRRVMLREASSSFSY